MSNTSSCSWASSESGAWSIWVNGVALWVSGDTWHSEGSSAWDVWEGEGSSISVDDFSHGLVSKSLFSSSSLKGGSGSIQKSSVLGKLVVDFLDGGSGIADSALSDTELFSEGSDVVVKSGLTVSEGAQGSSGLVGLAAEVLGSLGGVTKLSSEGSESSGEVLDKSVVGGDGVGSIVSSSVKVVKVRPSGGDGTFEVWQLGVSSVELSGSLSDGSWGSDKDELGIIQSLLGSENSFTSFGKESFEFGNSVVGSVEGILSSSDVLWGLVKSKLSISNDLSESGNVGKGFVTSILSIGEGLLSVSDGSQDVIDSLLEDWSLSIGSGQLSFEVSNLGLDIISSSVGSINLALEIGDVVGDGGDTVGVASLLLLGG